MGFIRYWSDVRKAQKLGMAHPQSQNNHAAKSLTESSNNKKKKKESQSSTGSGSGGETQSKKHKKNAKLHLQEDHTQPHPLSSKVYELINKGYIHETQPW